MPHLPNKATLTEILLTVLLKISHGSQNKDEPVPFVLVKCSHLTLNANNISPCITRYNQ